MRNRITYFLFAVAILAFLFAEVAYAADPLLERADQFASLLKDHQFKKCATMFHYPPTYTPAELAADEKFNFAPS